MLQFVSYITNMMVKSWKYWVERVEILVVEIAIIVFLKRTKYYFFPFGLETY